MPRSFRLSINMYLFRILRLIRNLKFNADKYPNCRYSAEKYFRNLNCSTENIEPIFVVTAFQKNSVVVGGGL